MTQQRIEQVFPLILYLGAVVTKHVYGLNKLKLKKRL